MSGTNNESPTKISIAVYEAKVVLGMSLFIYTLDLVLNSKETLSNFILIVTVFFATHYIDHRFRGPLSPTHRHKIRCTVNYVSIVLFVFVLIPFVPHLNFVETSKSKGIHSKILVYGGYHALRQNVDSVFRRMFIHAIMTIGKVAVLRVIINEVLLAMLAAKDVYHEIVPH